MIKKNLVAYIDQNHWLEDFMLLLPMH